MPVSNSLIYVGVLGNHDGAESQVREFIEKKVFEWKSSSYVLMTRSGHVVGSVLDGVWQLKAENLHEAFVGKPLPDADYQALALDYLVEAFSAVVPEFDRIEAASIITSFSKAMVLAVAASPRALDGYEWRDVERLLAEAFSGIGFDVQLTPGSKDGGKDILLKCTAHGKKFSYAIEVKHWRSGKVGSGVIKDFLQVIARESHDAGLVLANYGFSSGAIEVLSEIEQRQVHIGAERKIVSSCRTYVAARNGLVIPDNLLPHTFFKDTT